MDGDAWRGARAGPLLWRQKPSGQTVRLRKNLFPFTGCRLKPRMQRLQTPFATAFDSAVRPTILHRVKTKTIYAAKTIGPRLRKARTPRSLRPIGSPSARTSRGRWSDGSGSGGAGAKRRPTRATETGGKRERTEVHPNLLGLPIGYRVQKGQARGNVGSSTAIYPFRKELSAFWNET